MGTTISPSLRQRYPAGFTGTARRPPTRAQVQQLHEFMLSLRTAHPRSEIEWHHGGARRADAIAHLFAVGLGFRTVVHPGPASDPADFPFASVVLPREDNLIRDRDIACAGYELIAMPGQQREITRSGTWTTVRRAIRFNPRCLITLILPDGTVTEDIHEYTRTEAR